MKKQITTLKKGKFRTLTKEAMIKAIEGSFGNITLIAKRLNVYRSTVYDNIKKFDLSDMIESEREKIVDLAESKLIENIKAGKEVSIIFLLKTLGKSRGYVEKQELEVQDPIREKVMKMTDEERAKRIEELKQKLLNTN
jgi:Mn-dependent DtxR family transcriptional regulator